MKIEDKELNGFDKNNQLTAIPKGEYEILFRGYNVFQLTNENNESYFIKTEDLNKDDKIKLYSAATEHLTETLEAVKNICNNNSVVRNTIGSIGSAPVNPRRYIETGKRLAVELCDGWGGGSRRPEQKETETRKDRHHGQR